VRVLVVNAGSTSLKLSSVGEHEEVEEVEELESAVGVDAVGHRVVHGGERFVGPVVVDDAVEHELQVLTELAPLHNAPALDALKRTRAVFPAVPQVAVFDTAFHATMPLDATVYALPPRLRDLGIRRFGFHGISVQWASGQVRVPRLVVCHLGGGCSVTAVLDGKSVHTTMGFTPLEGVPMSTRSGSVDPGAITYLLRNGLIRVDELDQALEHESGLLGLSGVSGSVRELEASDDPAAALALRVFVRHVAAAVAAAVTTLSGLDALVFTGGVGEHSAGVRAGVAERLSFLGVALDPELNAAGDQTEMGRRGSPVRVVIVRSREELVIARETRLLLT
jgi:acetate kinase